MRRKRNIQNCSGFSLVFNNIFHCGNQFPGFPCKSASRLKNNMKTGSFLKIPYKVNQMSGIITLPRYQVPSPHIDPFQIVKKPAEFAFNNFKEFFKCIRIRFKQYMKMQSFYSVGKDFPQVFNPDTQPGTRRARIIQTIINFRKFRINT